MVPISESKAKVVPSYNPSEQSYNPSEQSYNSSEQSYNSSEQITTILQRLTGHPFIALTTRGNTAIDAAVSLLPKEKKVLIPDEGGWLHYRKGPELAGLKIEEVRCRQAVLDIADLRDKLSTKTFSALLYQNPGGYFAEQPMEDIYRLCQSYGCLVIIDVSGALGTKLCDGRYADFFVGSFGEWKLVDAGSGGFISGKNKTLFKTLQLSKENPEAHNLTTAALMAIVQRIHKLPQRIKFLLSERQNAIQGLAEFGLKKNIVKTEDLGFVVIALFSELKEKETIINYCTKRGLPWTECPRYIRINEPAISIEIKKLQNVG